MVLLGWGLPQAFQAVASVKTALLDHCHLSYHLPVEAERSGFQLGAGVVLFSPGLPGPAWASWPLLWAAVRLNRPRTERSATSSTLRDTNDRWIAFFYLVHAMSGAFPF